MIVFLLAPVSRVTDRMELPSHRRCRMRARSSVESLFVPPTITTLMFDRQASEVISNAQPQAQNRLNMAS